MTISDTLRDMLSWPLGTELGVIFSAFAMSSSTITRPVSAPRRSSSSISMLRSAPSLSIQPELALVLMMCSSCDSTLLKRRCGSMRFSTWPIDSPSMKYGKNGTTVKRLYGLNSSCRRTGPADTVQRIVFALRFITISPGVTSSTRAILLRSQFSGTSSKSPVSTSMNWSRYATCRYWRSISLYERCMSGSDPSSLYMLM